MHGVGRDTDADFGLCRMDPQQIKGAMISSIVALGKDDGLLNSPLHV